MKKMSIHGHGNLHFATPAEEDIQSGIIEHFKTLHQNGLNFIHNSTMDVSA